MRDDPVYGRHWDTQKTEIFDVLGISRDQFSGAMRAIGAKSLGKEVASAMEVILITTFVIVFLEREESRSRSEWDADYQCVVSDLKKWASKKVSFLA